MRPDVLHTLRARSGAIRECWERLLKLEGMSSALAHPDALAHLIPTSLFHIFDELERYRGAPLTLRAARGQALPPCPCGRNPYLAYFAAGEQALLEAGVLLQAETQVDQRQLSELAELVRAVRHVASAEIENFCGVCVLRSAAAERMVERTAAG